MQTAVQRSKLIALDRCLHLLEEALTRGKSRIDAPLGARLRSLLGAADLVPDHRLEGRRTERVLDDIFELQARLMGTSDDEEQTA